MRVIRSSLVLLWVCVLAWPVPARSQSGRVRVVLLAHEVLHPDSSLAFDSTERRIANTCLRIGCPHAYLAALPVGSFDPTTEVWWVNLFPSRDAMTAVERAWTRPDLADAIGALSARKVHLRRTLNSIMFTATNQPSSAMEIPRARFLVLAVDSSRNSAMVRRASFTSGDSVSLYLETARTESEAHRLAAQRGSRSVIVLRIVPEWSVPDTS